MWKEVGVQKYVWRGGAGKKATSIRNGLSNYRAKGVVATCVPDINQQNTQNDAANFKKIQTVFETVDSEYPKKY